MWRCFDPETLTLCFLSSRRWWMLCVKSLWLFGMLKKGRILIHASFCFNGPWHVMPCLFSSRLWIFPQSSLSSAEIILRQVSSVKVEVSLKVQLQLASLRYIALCFSSEMSGRELRSSCATCNSFCLKSSRSTA